MGKYNTIKITKKNQNQKNRIMQIKYIPSVLTILSFLSDVTMQLLGIPWVQSACIICLDKLKETKYEISADTHPTGTKFSTETVKYINTLLPFCE